MSQISSGSSKKRLDFKSIGFHHTKSSHLRRLYPDTGDLWSRFSIFRWDPFSPLNSSDLTTLIECWSTKILVLHVEHSCLHDWLAAVDGGIVIFSDYSYRKMFAVC